MGIKIISKWLNLALLTGKLPSLSDLETRCLKQDSDSGNWPGTSLLMWSSMQLRLGTDSLTELVITETRRKSAKAFVAFSKLAMSREKTYSLSPSSGTPSTRPNTSDLHLREVWLTLALTTWTCTLSTSPLHSSTSAPTPDTPRSGSTRPMLRSKALSLRKE